MRPFPLPVPLFLLVATTAACDVVGAEEGGDDDESLTEVTEVARVTTDDGGVWRFQEGEPGELFVWATVPESTGAEAGQLTADEPSYVELHRRLTSAPVPQELLDAEARAEAVAVESAEESDDGGLVNEAGGQVTSAGQLTRSISAEDFQDDYCSSGIWDYDYCWPSFYGSPYVQRKVYSMYGYLAAVNNTVDFRLRHKKFSTSSWSTLISGQALPGQLHHVYSTYFGYRRWRRWEVLDNGANLVRYSCYGTE